MRKAPLVLAGLLVLIIASNPSAADPKVPDKDPVAVGARGAVSTVDPVATQAGLAILRKGGNAIDAAVAAAATLGVTEPYSAGIGGGGFMVIHLADEDRVVTIDGREDAPDDAQFDADVFTERTSSFFDAVNSGLSVGTPGTLATWVEALDEYGTMSLAKTLQPAIRTARTGFTVDETFAEQTKANLARFRQIAPTAKLFLDDGQVPEVGSRFRNVDLAHTYRLIARRGADAFYKGPIARDIVATVQDPPTTGAATEAWQPGLLTVNDLATYEALRPAPARSQFRGYDIYGMPPPSSGGITVGETLNILEGFAADAPAVAFWHRYLEASALAFADRNAYIGDDRYVEVPQTGLLSDDYAADRRQRIGVEALTKPVAAGDPCPYEPDGCPQVSRATAGAPGQSTTHLVTSDRWGNVVSYTLTIEATGGSAITVPGRGFLLNNELTDFNFTGPSPNLAAPGKRPRSSMSPTIVLSDGEPLLAVGSPGGSTIITTVAQILLLRLDRGLSLPEAIAAPRATQRNTTAVQAEPKFLAATGSALQDRGHTFTSIPEIGAATGLEFLSDGQVLAAAEPVRRGGGDAGVVKPVRSTRKGR